MGLQRSQSHHQLRHSVEVHRGRHLGGPVIYTLDDVANRLSPEQLAQVEEASWVSEFGHKSDALTLTVGWANHVDKLDKDRRLPWEDHSVWTEHDLEAALRIRDRLAQALSRLPDRPEACSAPAPTGRGYGAPPRGHARSRHCGPPRGGAGLCRACRHGSPSQRSA